MPCARTLRAPGNTAAGRSRPVVQDHSMDNIAVETRRGQEVVRAAPDSINLDNPVKFGDLGALRLPIPLQEGPLDLADEQTGAARRIFQILTTRHQARSVQGHVKLERSEHSQFPLNASLELCKELLRIASDTVRCHDAVVDLQHRSAWVRIIPGSYSPGQNAHDDQGHAVDDVQVHTDDIRGCALEKHRQLCAAAAASAAATNWGMLGRMSRKAETTDADTLVLRRWC
mmetsp:Transcript_56125/g.162575  ORF Transcript_56125/g.162575 Transcript_56125/m.162575 type:complete len:229 (-) Transcript_56125:439-1125(-)